MRQCDQRSRLVALILADMFGPLVGAVGSDLLVFGTKTFGQITASTGDIWNDLFRIHFQFRIRIQPILFKHIWKLFFKKHLTFNQKEESTVPTICLFLFHTTVLQYTQSGILRPKLRN